MILRIARKEATELAREGRFLWSAALLAVLLVAALAAGWRQGASVRAQHEEAGRAQRRLWLEKGEMNPHSAAHYGSFAFKPREPLAAVDPGLDPFLGVSVFLEAHRQNLAKHRPVEDAMPSSRLGVLSAAGLLQLFVPLLVVALAHSAFAGERERGTLRQLASLGVSPRTLALGKALGTAAPLAALLVPAALVGVLALALSTGGTTAARAALLALLYSAYFALWVGLALLVSLRAASARAALVTLVALWFATGFLAPRAAAVLARAVSPSPSAADLQRAIAAEARGHLGWEQQVERARETIRREHGLGPGDPLPVHPEVVALIEGEKEDTALYARHFKGLHDAWQRQEGTYGTAGLVAPLLSVQSVSMGLAGTDLAHFRRFSDAAEAYRVGMVSRLNDAILDHSRESADIWDYQAGRPLWEKVPPFEYESPGAGWALRNHGAAVLALGAWLVGVALLLVAAMRRPRLEAGA